MFAAASVAHGAIWYVDTANMDGPWTGTSWNGAFVTIQEGIDAAANDGGGDVRVAQGIYGEMRPGSATGSLVLRPGVRVYGGYAGPSEANANTRDVAAYVTVIDGAAARAGSAAYHVVVGADNATLDGFTISGGNANGGFGLSSGGGIYNVSVSPTVIRCVIANNSADSVGGGVYNSNGAPVFQQCALSGNSSANGGAMYNSAAAPVITECSFTGNAANGGHGGAMYTFSLSNPTISGCTFNGNSSAIDGGALYNNGSSCTCEDSDFEGNSSSINGGAATSTGAGTVRFERCLIRGNTAPFGGGAMACSYGAGVELVNCVVAQNTSNVFSAGIYVNKAVVSVTNCTLYGNAASTLLSSSGAAYVAAESTLAVRNSILWANSVPAVYSDGTTTVTYSDVQSGYTGAGNIAANPLFVAADDFHLQEGSPCIDKGTASGAPAIDIEGVSRPQLGGIDMGAYEYSSAPVIVTDINGIGGTDAVDVQLVINAALGLDVDYNCDVNGVDGVTAVDVQLVINGALGLL